MSPALSLHSAVKRIVHGTKHQLGLSRQPSACNVLLVRLDQGHLVFFLPAQEIRQIVCQCQGPRPLWLCVYPCECLRALASVKKKKKSGCGCQREKKVRLACENVYIWPCACVYIMVLVWETVWETKIACAGSNEKTPLPLCRVNVRVRSLDGLCVCISFCVCVWVRMYTAAFCIWKTHQNDYFLLMGINWCEVRQLSVNYNLCYSALVCTS